MKLLLKIFERSEATIVVIVLRKPSDKLNNSLLLEMMKPWWQNLESVGHSILVSNCCSSSSTWHLEGQTRNIR